MLIKVALTESEWVDVLQAIRVEVNYWSIDTWVQQEYQKILDKIKGQLE